MPRFRRSPKLRPVSGDNVPMLIWPLPALLTWALAWGVYLTLGAAGAHTLLAFVAGVAAAAAMAMTGKTVWRRVFMVAGFPLSLWASGAAVGWTAWVWLVPLLLLLVLYPVNTWRDAPLFPTPSSALQGLAEAIPLAPSARVVDAGCGLGAGLMELHRVYPQAQLAGWEWSWPLSLLCRLRCGFALVRRADIWAENWSTFDMIYLFQRPESMPRVMEKAERECPAGRWVVSLEFEASGYKPRARLETVEGKPVWIYQTPFQRA